MKNRKNWLLSGLLLLIFTSFQADDRKFLVTASMSRIGVTAGMKILEEGGTAMDAALSVALSEIAETGGKYISYAGAMEFVYYEEKTGKLYNLNAGFNTIQNETEPLIIPAVSYNMVDTLQNISDGRAILVPGFMKGVEEAHRKFGKVPFQKLFESAIEIAEKGTDWDNDDNANFLRWKKVLTYYPETKKIFVKPDGSFYRVGETFHQPELAKTLKRISLEGADYMYTGEWARKFVRVAQGAGSKITLKDLSDYKVIWTNPICGKYKEYDLFVNGEPDMGGAQLIEALNIAEEIKLSEIGHYSKSPVALATIYQILAATLYSSNLPSYYGDSIELNTESRIKKETSKRVWEIWKAKNNLKAIFSERNKNEHTAAIVAIDKYGNMVALIHTISVPNWGSGGLFVDGISIPDPANQRQQLIEKTGPGKRMPGETVPLLVFKNGKPVYGSACISGGAHNQTFVSLLNVFDFNLSPQESVEMPGIGEFSFIENELSLSVEPNKFQDSLLIKARGKRAYLNESPSIMSVFWTGIHINEKSGELHGTKVWLK